MRDRSGLGVYRKWTVLQMMILAAGLLRPLAAQQVPVRFLAGDTVFQGKGDGELRYPVAVAAATDVQIAVADAISPRLVIFELASGEWTVERTIPLPAAPRDLINDGRRYVLSLGDGKLVAVTEASWEVRRLPLPSGTVPGRLAARLGGGFWVHDMAGEKLLALEGDGDVGAEVQVRGTFTALASAVDGGFYAAVAAVAEVRHYDRRGQLRMTWTVPGDGPIPAWPSGVVVDSGGNLLVVDRHGGRIVALDASGRLVGVGSQQGWEPGQLRFPSALALLPDGRLVVADQGNSRVQIFRPLPRKSPP